MAKYTVSVTAAIDTSSLVEGRSEAKRLVELLTDEFLSVAYCVEVLEPDHGHTVFEESGGGEPATYH
jgi:hypothetical protein